MTTKKDNNGHGNNEDGVDSSNPGKSKAGQDSDPNVDDEAKGGKSSKTSNKSSGSNDKDCKPDSKSSGKSSKSKGKK